MSTVKYLCRTPSILAVAAAAAIFLLDLELPNGVIDGVLYVLVVLVSGRHANPRAAVYTAAALMPLMVLGFLLSPMAAPLWVAVTNRAVSVLVIWVAAWLLWRHSREAAMDKSVMADIPLLLTEAVRDDLVLQLGIIEWRLQRLPYFAHRTHELKKEALILTSALKNARRSVRTMDTKIHNALDELAVADK